MRSGPRVLRVAGAILFACCLFPAPARADPLPAEVESSLRSADLIYVATRRRSGETSSVKPVWFYYRGGGELFFTTSPNSWKAKRIARGSPLFIWVGAKDGPFLVGEASPVSDAELVDRMGEAYAEKYWIAWLGFFQPRSGRVTAGKTRAYLVRLRPGDPPPPAR